MPIEVRGLAPLLEVFDMPRSMKQLYVTDTDGYNLCLQWKVSP